MITLAGIRTFELAWRLWLRAWNLLQVLPGASLVTSQGVENASEGRGRAPAVARPSPAAAREVARRADARLAAVLEITDEDAQEIVVQLLEMHPQLASPRVPLELRRPGFDIEGDLEIGWPEHRVAAHLEDQSQIAEVLRSAGWQVFSIERKLDLKALERALGVD